MDLDYTDETKAIAHDQDRYVWEHESGFAYAGLSEGFTFDHLDLSSALSKGYEQGFSRGWDAAVKKIAKAFTEIGTSSDLAVSKIMSFTDLMEEKEENN